MIQFFKNFKKRFKNSKLYLSLILNEIWYGDKHNIVYIGLQSALQKADVLKYVNFVLINYRSGKIYVTIYSANPGIIIGVRGSAISEITETLARFLNRPVNINVKPYNPLMPKY